MVNKQYEVTCPVCGENRIVKRSQYQNIRSGESSGLCQECAIKRKSQNPEWRRKISESHKILAQDPEWQKKHREQCVRVAQNPEWQRKHKEMVQRTTHDPEIMRRKIETLKKLGIEKRFDPDISNKILRCAVICPDCGKVRAVSFTLRNRIVSGKTLYRCPSCAQKINQKIINQDPIRFKEKVKKQSETMKKVCADPVYRARQIEINRRIVATPECRLKVSEAHKRLFKTSPEHKEKHTNACRRISRDLNRNNKISDTSKEHWKNPQYVEKRLITIFGEGFWYGHEVLTRPPVNYCELWRDVNPRVHAFFDYKCCLCGKPENGRSHIGHHVFYVKEACCWYDESGVYYTNLNARDHKEKDYCIGDNPNYFVILCPGCHGKTNGGFETRKKWADYFKKMIDEQYGGKCYYTKEEIEQEKVLRLLRLSLVQQPLLIGV